MSDPAKPSLVASYEPRGVPSDLAVAGSLVFLAVPAVDTDAIGTSAPGVLILRLDASFVGAPGRSTLRPADRTQRGEGWAIGGTAKDHQDTWRDEPGRHGGTGSRSTKTCTRRSGLSSTSVIQAAHPSVTTTRWRRRCALGGSIASSGVLTKTGTCGCSHRGKANSRWSTANRRRYADLQTRGLLAVSGVKRAPTHRSGDAPRPSVSAIPSYIMQALKTNTRAQRCFEELAPSYRRMYISWIGAAKREETKQKRLREAITLLAAGKKLGLK